MVRQTMLQNAVVVVNIYHKKLNWAVPRLGAAFLVS